VCRGVGDKAEVRQVKSATKDDGVFRVVTRA
jgi:hypothetical protein